MICRLRDSHCKTMHQFFFFFFADDTKQAKITRKTKNRIVAKVHTLTWILGIL